MTDAERIRVLVERGTLDATQAQRILTALAELDAGEQVVGEVSGAAGADTGRTTATRRWLRVHRRTARLDVRVDEALDDPVIDGAPPGTTIREDGDSWRLEAPTDDGTSWTQRLFRDASVPVTRVRVPSGVGLDVDVAVGSLDVEGLPAVRGRVAAGEVEVEGVQHVDVHVVAGEVDVTIDPHPTVHRLRVDTGAAKVTLPRHADVAVRGSIRVGDAQVEAPFREHSRGIVGRTVDGALGAGSAVMHVEIGTGTLTVEVD